MKIAMKSNIRPIFFSAFIAAAIALMPQQAFAIDLFGGGLGAAMNGQVGVSTHINNTPVYAPLGAGIDDRDRQIYSHDAQERTIRQREAVTIYQDTSMAPADIAPAAGTPGYIRLRPLYNMGQIQGGRSYND